MKKFLSLLLAVMMLLGCLPAMAEDAEWKINLFTSLVSRRSAAEKLDSIVVPAEVDGIAVRGIEYMAFSMYKNFKQLTIADNAAMLDRRVLRDLLKLEAVELPESLLIIREGNFTNLPKLTSVVIPANVVLVHSSFNKCASLTSITFEGMCPIFVTAGTFGMFTDLPADCVIYVPDNQVSAYKAAFADREDVVARIQPSGRNAERIDRPATESGFAFDASTGTITRYTGTADYLVIPTTIDGVQVKHIADFAFETNVCCIIIPEGVETIGRYSLGHELLTYVSLPSTLTNVG
ncbi:MAG: leucine-rich repeat protein, partial [Clostridia bacterium]|nr:leucine-rich repeat protein [Clostridia bacterium]